MSYKSGHKILTSVAMAALLATSSYASLTGTVYEWNVPHIQAGPGAGQTIWEPLSFNFDINSSQVDLDFTSWTYKNYAGGTWAVVNIVVNGAPYHSTNFTSVPTVKTTTPNCLFSGYIPETDLLYGENDVYFYISFGKVLQHGLIQTFRVRAKVYRS